MRRLVEVTVNINHLLALIALYYHAVVVSILLQHGVTNTKLAEQGCFAISNLLVDNDENKTKLGATGACEG